jgi:nucleotide-binding universal stress UspA family protein
MYKHILLPTDGSKLSARVVQEGVRFAKSINAQVTALHVTGLFFPSGIPSHAEVVAKVREHEQRAAESAKHALSAAEEAARSAGVTCTALHRSSDNPWEEIIKGAQEECRNCHSAESMELSTQNRLAQRGHKAREGSDLHRVAPGHRAQSSGGMGCATYGFESWIRRNPSTPGSSTGSTDRSAWPRVGCSSEWVGIQGLGNVLILPRSSPDYREGPATRRPRLGGSLNYYERAAAWQSVEFPDITPPRTSHAKPSRDHLPAEEQR